MELQQYNNSSKPLPFDAGLVCKMADQFDDFDAAFRMVYENYLTIGLIEPNPFERRVLSHHLCSGTNTFIAYRQGEPVCTTTLISDSPHGLPIDSVFPFEIERKRRLGLTLAEVSCLASRTGSRASFHRLFMRLMRILGQHSRRFGIDQLVVAVHPKHASYYERTMGFHRFSDEVTYESLHNAPAVGIAMDFRETEVSRPPAYDLIFGTELSLMEILPRPMLPELVEHYRPMVNTSEECIPLIV